MLRRLAASRDRADVGIVVRAEFGELFEDHPALRRVHRFDKKGNKGMPAIVEELRVAGYTLALIPHRSMRSALVARRAGIARRIGFRQSDAPWLLTDRVEYDIARHETARNAALLARAGYATPAGDDLPWLVPGSAREAMRARYAGRGGVIAIAPGSVWPTKRWTPEGYAGLVASLMREGKRPVLIGSGGELELCRAIARQAGLPGEEVACGSLSLSETLALIAIAERVVTNDSAPLHLAESVGTPVTAIFGPTVPEFGFGPRAADSRVVEIGELPCRPCRIHGSRRCPIGTHECMRGISAAEVLAASLAGDATNAR
jgi:heptosyltransferase-2